MKKLLCLCLTVLMLVCCFGFVGCDKEEVENINYTAERPIIDFVSDREYKDNETTGKTETILLFKDRQNSSIYEQATDFNKFEDLSEYYSNNMKGENFYLMRCGYPMYGFLLTSEHYFDFYKERDGEELLLAEHYAIYDEELGTKDYGDKATGIHITVSFVFFIKPIKKIESEFKFEFGKYTMANGIINKYINIFLDEKCFATCYFSNHVNIPQEWYENYLKTNLIYGDEL